MIPFLTEFNHRRLKKKLLLALRDEIAKNLEHYYVLSQINRFRFFQMDQWNAAQNLEQSAWPPEVLEYARRLGQYNDDLKNFNDYETWYTADSKNKTRDNGQVLHEKKQTVKSSFQGLEEVIKNTQLVYDASLEKLGYSKKK